MSTHRFETRHAEFDGFSDFYAAEVAPVLADREEVRAKAVRKGMTGGVIAGLVILMGALAVFIHWGNIAIGLFLASLSVMAGAGIFYLATNAIREETKDRIVQSIVGYVGWTFTTRIPDQGLTPFEALFLLPPKHDRASFEDALEGEAHGAAFRSFEAHLEKRTRDSDGDTKWDTVFRGQLMTLDFPTRTFGRTVVLRDKGWFNPKKKSDMKRIGLADPVFEKTFEAYGTDQVEGRVILNPDFMQRMVDLEAAVSGRNIRYGFDDDTLFIAVETGNQFEAGSMFKSLTDPSRTQKILDEVGAVFDIADMLLDRPARPRR